MRGVFFGGAGVPWGVGPRVKPEDDERREGIRAEAREPDAAPAKELATSPPLRHPRA